MLRWFYFSPVFVLCILFARVIWSTYMTLTVDCDLYIYIPALTSLLLDSDFYQQAAYLYLVVEYYMPHKLNMGNIHLIYIFSLFSWLPTWFSVFSCSVSASLFICLLKYYLDSLFLLFLMYTVVGLLLGKYLLFSYFLSMALPLFSHSNVALLMVSLLLSSFLS